MPSVARGVRDGHIPGAIHVYWLEDLSAADTTVTTFLPSRRKPPHRSAGWNHAEKTVVAYSDGGNLYASRLWHVLTHSVTISVALLEAGSRNGRPRAGRSSAAR